MGRIAEALKRAQQERSRRREGEAERDSAHPVVAENKQATVFAQRESPLKHHDVLGQAMASSEMPPAPEPFVVDSPPLPPESIDRRVVVFHDSQSPIAEKYRSVRTRLLTSNPNGSSRVFTVTSSVAKEGKTVTTANLGFSLAELRHLRVAVLDFDFRQKGLSRLCRVEDKPGVADVLRGDKTLASVCLPVVRGNLHLIPTGNCDGSNPSEILASDRISALIREISGRYHYALIDTPPLNTFADAGVIAPWCHSAILVVRMGSTPEHLLSRCTRMLQENRVPIVGAVLSGYYDETIAGSDPREFLVGAT